MKRPASKFFLEKLRVTLGGGGGGGGGVTLIHWDTGCAIFWVLFSMKINFWVYFVACNKFLDLVFSLE